MRVAFKSLFVVEETKSTFGDITTIRTTYDMNSVHDHELELEWWTVAFHPGVLWRVALLMCMPAFLLGLWTEWNVPWMLMFSLPFLLLFWPLSYAVVHNALLVQHAISERGIPADSRVNVVLAKRWAVFLSDLQPAPRLVVPRRFDEISPEIREAILRIQSARQQ